MPQSQTTDQLRAPQTHNSKNTIKIEHSVCSFSDSEMIAKLERTLRNVSQNMDLRQTLDTMRATKNNESTIT